VIYFTLHVKKKTIFNQNQISKQIRCRKKQSSVSGKIRTVQLVNNQNLSTRQGGVLSPRSAFLNGTFLFSGMLVAFLHIYITPGFNLDSFIFFNAWRKLIFLPLVH
jgi:hypothetical protein